MVSRGTSETELTHKKSPALRTRGRERRRWAWEATTDPPKSLKQGDSRAHKQKPDRTRRRAEASRPKRKPYRAVIGVSELLRRPREPMCRDTRV